MNQKQKGIQTGIGALLAAVVLLLIVLSIGSLDLTGMILWAIDIALFVLAVLSFWKPEFFGPIVQNILNNLGSSGGGRSRGHSKKQTVRNIYNLNVNNKGGRLSMDNSTNKRNRYR